MKHLCMVHKGGRVCPAADLAGGETFHCRPWDWPEIKKDSFDEKGAVDGRVGPIPGDIENIQVGCVAGCAHGMGAVVGDKVDLVGVRFDNVRDEKVCDSKNVHSVR